VIRMTRSDAHKYLRKAMEERGRGYKYMEHFTTCVNVHDGKPACMVGLALWRFGEENGLPEGFMLNYTGGTAISLRDRLKGDGLIDMSKGATLILRMAQTKQDAGSTWGEAYEAASNLSYDMDGLAM